MHVESFGWHSGDLKTRKAEHSSQMNATRSSGYFGSGWYFLMGEEPLRYKDDRELWKINLEPYNLFKGTIELHETLKKLTRYVFSYNKKSLLDDYKVVGYFMSDEYGRRRFSSIDSEEHGYDEFKESAIKIGFDPHAFELLENRDEPQPSEEDLAEYERQKELYDKELDSLPFEEQLERIMKGDAPHYPSATNEWSEEIRRYDNMYDDDWLGAYRDLSRLLSDHTVFMASFDLNVDDETLTSILKDVVNRYEMEDDNIPTLIMKSLGYEGIYPSEECNNGFYGGVIYDLKDGTYEKVADPIKNSYALNESEIMSSLIVNNKHPFEKITPNFVRRVLSKSEYWYDYGMKDKFDPFQKEFDSFLDKIETDGDSLILYRSIYLSSPDKLITHDKRGNPYLGICWTISDELFRKGKYFNSGKKPNTLLKAKVSVDDVDWKNTLTNYYFNSFSTDSNKENEIRLKSKSNVELLDVIYE